MMGLKPEEVLYAGDSNTDIQTGKNAGMDTIGVSWGFRGAGELKEKRGFLYCGDAIGDLKDRIQ